MQRLITSRSILDSVIPSINAWKSLQWSEKTSFGSHAAVMGKQKIFSKDVATEPCDAQKADD